MLTDKEYGGLTTGINPHFNHWNARFIVLTHCTNLHPLLVHRRWNVVIDLLGDTLCIICKINPVRNSTKSMLKLSKGSLQDRFLQWRRQPATNTRNVRHLKTGQDQFSQVAQAASH